MTPKEKKVLHFKEDQPSKPDSKRVEALKKSSRKVSITEGGFANAASGFGVSYITPFALALNATPFHIGLLSSFSGLLGPLSQLSGSKLMEKHSRKKIVMLFVLLQSLIWLPIAALSYLFIKGIFVESLPLILVALYSLIAITGGLTFPAWFSWMGDIVPEDQRGRYFAKRNRIAGVIGLIAFLLGAFLLDMFKTKGLALIGFSILFGLAFTGRLISTLLFKKQFSPKFKLKKGYYFSFWSFLKRFDNFGKFSIFSALFYFSLMIASPFFAVYMLEDLQFSYLTFTIVTMSASVFYLLFGPLAGKFSDKFGNLKLITIGCLLLVTYPIFWIFLKSPISLILLPQLVAGIANAALIIGFTNFIYDSVTPQHRGLCAAYNNVLIGIGIFLGSILGGLLAKFAPGMFTSIFFIVFGASAALRLLVSVIMLPQLKEERKVKRLPPMHIHLSHPFKTLHHEVGWFKHVFG